MTITQITTAAVAITTMTTRTTKKHAGIQNNSKIVTRIQNRSVVHNALQLMIKNRSITVQLLMLESVNH